MYFNAVYVYLYAQTSSLFSSYETQVVNILSTSFNVDGDGVGLLSSAMEWKAIIKDLG